jgi:hypothetical protein
VNAHEASIHFIEGMRAVDNLHEFLAVTRIIEIEKILERFFDQVIHDAIRMDLPGAPDDGTIERWMKCFGFGEHSRCICHYEGYQDPPTDLPCPFCMAHRIRDALDFAEASLMKFATDSEAFQLGLAAGKLEGAKRMKEQCVAMLNDHLRRKWRTSSLEEAVVLVEGMALHQDTVAATEEPATVSGE